MNIVPLERSVTSGASGKMTRHWPIGRAPSFSQGQILVSRDIDETRECSFLNAVVADEDQLVAGLRDVHPHRDRGLGGGRQPAGLDQLVLLAQRRHEVRSARRHLPLQEVSPFRSELEAGAFEAPLLVLVRCRAVPADGSAQARRLPMLEAGVPDQAIDIFRVCRSGGVRLDHFPLSDDSRPGALEVRPDVVPAGSVKALMAACSQTVIAQDEQLLALLRDIVANRLRIGALLREDNLTDRSRNQKKGCCQRDKQPAVHLSSPGRSSRSRSSQYTAPSTSVALASAAMVAALVSLVSRITNLRLRAISAISRTVLTWTMLSRRTATRMIECLNSRAMSSVITVPKIPWKTSGSSGSRAPRIRSGMMRRTSCTSASAMTTATTRLSTIATTCSKRS